MQQFKKNPHLLTGDPTAWTQETSGSFGLKQRFPATSRGEKSLKMNTILSEMLQWFCRMYT